MRRFLILLLPIGMAAENTFNKMSTLMASNWKLR